MDQAPTQFASREHTLSERKRITMIKKNRREALRRFPLQFNLLVDALSEFVLAPACRQAGSFWLLFKKKVTKRFA